jgi:hypothetical protein
MRNCTGSGSPAKVFLNHQLYRRCPRAIFLENLEARYLVGLYFECRETRTYPAPGGPSEQTAFTMELFDFLDGIVGETRQKNHASAQSAATPKPPSKK